MIETDFIQHTILFDDEIRTESIQDLMDKMSQYPFVNLHFTTDGGELHTMLAFIGYLNRRHYQDTVRVYLDLHCISAGTLLLTDYEGHLYITPSFRYFYFHTPDYMAYQKRKSTVEPRLRELLDIYNEGYFEKLRTNVGLTKTQVDKIRNGDEVYIYADELSRLKKTFVVDDYMETRKTFVAFTPAPTVKK